MQLIYRPEICQPSKFVILGYSQMGTMMTTIEVCAPLRTINFHFIFFLSLLAASKSDFTLSEMKEMKDSDPPV